MTLTLCDPSDGWDRTSQTCAVAQLLLDPFYRWVESGLANTSCDWPVLHPMGSVAQGGCSVFLLKLLYLSDWVEFSSKV